MLIARQIAHALGKLCPGLSAEGMAAALGIHLCPLPCVRYRYVRDSAGQPRVEYDCLATPAEQERALQRAAVLRCLDSLKLAAGTPSIIDITDEVFSRLRFPAKRSA
jgi:hypothetical protein